MAEEKQVIGGVEFSNTSNSEFNIGSIVTNQTAGRDIVGGDKITLNIHQPSILSPVEARDLNILLKNVETSWIKGVLEKSVHHAVLLDLGKEVRPEAIEHPWETVIGRPGQADQSLPVGTRISAIFEEIPLLLILGEPGSGKTITLLELTRDLIAKVRTDATFTQPIPVIFNLSTWTNKKQPLNEWVIEELQSKYQTPQRLGRTWLEQRRILPLLDGLDEVKPENQAACVEAINRFAVDYAQGLVVCSRLKEYLQLPTRLKFYGAIYLRPLDETQIDQYLTRAKGKLQGLRELLQQDEPLRILAQSPLMLNIMSLVYQGRPVGELSTSVLKNLETRREVLFDAYIREMFKRKGKARPYDDTQTKARLCWLARNMRRHNQELFLIEGLQPSWLQRRGWRWSYSFASRLISGLSVGIIIGLIGGYWLIGGLIIGLSVGFIDILRFEWLDKQVEVRIPSTFWWPVINIVVIGLSVGLIAGLIIGPIGGLTNGLIGGLIYGIRGSLRGWSNDVQTIEALYWSWRKALKGGLIFGLMFGLIFGLIFGLLGLWLANLTAGLILGQSRALFFGMLFGLGGAMFSGLSRKIVETKTAPNQGIRLSLRNAALGGVIVGLSVGLTFGLGRGLGFGLTEGVSFGLLFGLSGALWYGALDVIQHYTLRLILLIQGHTPGDYAHFLDYAVERIFLQKVGGGYRFIHRLLLEHFAAMGESNNESRK